MDGVLAYPSTPQEHMQCIALWHRIAGNKPHISFLHFDLFDAPDAPTQRHRFSLTAGRWGLITELDAMREPRTP